MILHIAGGCGEHGRNCFYVEGEKQSFMVDCGIRAQEGRGGYPHLSLQQIEGCRILFLTHSHLDHAGALAWIIERGFKGTVIASGETLRQINCAMRSKIALEEIGPTGKGEYRDIDIQWGRSGHCMGSVWYLFKTEEKNLLFSGDYIEETKVYACDKIRGKKADIAVLDCAYGRDQTSYAIYCSRIIKRVKELREVYPVLFFPVPGYGRGMELLVLMLASGIEGPFYGDVQFVREWQGMARDNYWKKKDIFLPAEMVQVYQNAISAGIVFLSDPQLKKERTKICADRILFKGGHGILTGNVEADGYSAWLAEKGKMTFLRYPIHGGLLQLRCLLNKNTFQQAIPYHTEQWKVPERFLI